MFAKRILFLLVLISHLFSGHFCKTAEIDSITPYSIYLPDSTLAINKIINERLLEGIDAANKRQGSFTFFADNGVCNDKILYVELRKAIFQSFSASLGFKGYSLDKQLRNLLKKQSYSLSLQNSIYRDINLLEGFSLNLKELSDIVQLRGQLIGLEKFGHFFAEGWTYFAQTQYENQDITKVMEWGKEQEKGKFGYLTTGIFSYGDLVANFNGLRFWNRVRKSAKDPIKGVIINFFTRPYITCDIHLIASIKQRKIVRKWVLNKPFDITDYVDGSWNEANNCNSFKDPIIETKVASRIAEIRPDFSCPADNRTCIEARNKYGVYAKNLLHPQCLIAAENN